MDGHEAAAELERVVRGLGFKGVEVLTNVAGRELSDSAFAPFWVKAAELGVLVVIHPSGFAANPLKHLQRLDLDYPFTGRQHAILAAVHAGGFGPVRSIRYRTAFW